MISNPKIHNILCIFVVLLGWLQMIGHVTGLDPIKNIGKLTVASPLPLVFTSVKGVETFAQEFYLEYESDDQDISRKITPELYSQFSASYNFRNVLGAAVSYAPVLPDEMRDSVLYYCFNQNKEISTSLEIPQNATHMNLKIINISNQQSYHFPIMKAEGTTH